MLLLRIFNVLASSQRRLGSIERSSQASLINNVILSVVEGSVVIKQIPHYIRNDKNQEAPKSCVIQALCRNRHSRVAGLF